MVEYRMSLFSNAFVGLRLAWRARFFLIVSWLVIVLCAAAWMGAQFSGRQPATVAMDMGVSLIRVMLPFVAVLMLQELVTREFDRRYFLASLSYPRPRWHFLLGRLLALMGLSSLLLVLLASALAVVVSWHGRGYTAATPVSLGWEYWLTMTFILLDLFVILSLALLLSVVASTPSFVVVGTLGFLLIARSFSAIIVLLQQDAGLVSNSQVYAGSLGLLSYLLPDLGALDVRMVALYGRMEFLPLDWPWLILANVAYASAFLMLAVWALNRKRFV